MRVFSHRALVYISQSGRCKNHLINKWFQSKRAHCIKCCFLCWISMLMTAAIKLGASAFANRRCLLWRLRSQVYSAFRARTLRVWGLGAHYAVCLYIGVFMDVWHCSSHTGHLDAFQESELFELPNIRRRARERASERLARPHFYRPPPIKRPRRPLFLLSADFTPRNAQPITINLHRTSTPVNQNWAMTMPTDDSIHAPVRIETPRFVTSAQDS